MTLPATPKGSWISKELKQVYGAKAWKAGKGVDLNGNGRLEKNEKISTYNTNRIPGNDKRVVGDWTDWLAFYRANHSVINHRAIHAKVGKNTNSIFLWAAKFKTTNPLHIITSIESPLVKQPQVLKAYKKTWQIIARARKIPIKGSTKVKRAKAKLLAVRSAIIKSGINITRFYAKSPLLIENMVSGELDCDTASFVILVEAHEKAWPLFGVRVPRHFFLRWDNRRTRIKFNIDTNRIGRFPTDRKYKAILRMAPQAISAGVYLKNLGLSALISSVIKNRAIRYKDLGRNKEALRDYTEAIDLDTKNIMAYSNRGVVYGKLGGSASLLNAIKDFTKSIKLDPDDVFSYRNLGIIYLKRGKPYKAISEFSKAIKLNRKYAAAYLSRAIVRHAQGNHSAALKDFLKTISLDSNPTRARNRLANMLFKNGKAHYKTKNYAGAVKDFKMLLRLNPKHTTVRALIKRCTQMALQRALISAVRKVYGASNSESYVKTVLKTQSWSTLKQLGIAADIQKAFGKLGFAKAARNSYFAQKLLKKTLKNW